MTSPTTGQALQSHTALNGTGFLDSPFRYVLFPVVNSIIFILGAIANTYVLFVLRSLREAKTMGEIRIYMTSLTIADLLFACTLPFWAGYYSRGGDWVHTDFMCRLAGTMIFINIYCPVLFLGAISVSRYWAVTRPLDAASSDHRRRGIIISVVIWVVIVLLGIPQLMNQATSNDANNITRCFEGYHLLSDTQKKSIVIAHFSIIGAVFVIFALVVVCNFLIARALVSQNVPGSEFRSTNILPRKSNLKRKTLQMLLAVVGVFALCFLPLHVVRVPWLLAVMQIQEGWGRVDWEQDTLQVLNDVHQITMVLISLNCIFDPVVYFFATSKFRRIIKTHVKKFVRGEGCSKTVG